MANCRHTDSLTGLALKKLILLVMVLALIMPFAAIEAFASTSVTISCDDKLKGGDTFTVEVNFGGGVGRVDAALEYDTDKLTYISGGSSSGNSGYIQLSQGGTDGNVTFNIKFQAVSDGNTRLSLSTYELYDLNESYIDEQPAASKDINISGNANLGELLGEEESSEKPSKVEEKIGVDEKTDGSALLSQKPLVLIVAAVLVVAVIIVVAVLISRKKKGKGESASKSKSSKEYQSKH